LLSLLLLWRTPTAPVHERARATLFLTFGTETGQNETQKTKMSTYTWIVFVNLLLFVTACDVFERLWGTASSKAIQHTPHRLTKGVTVQVQAGKSIETNR
jgi:hypothetical protein